MLTLNYEKKRNEGNPCDNAILESFYRGPLEKELVQYAYYDNPEQALQEILKYIKL